VVQVVLGGTGDWMPLSGRVSVPDNSQSVRYRVLLDTPFGDPLDGYVDETFLGAGTPIFGDGFESGDATSWSIIVPQTPNPTPAKATRPYQSVGHLGQP
jgi:hypothetical protein